MQNYRSSVEFPHLKMPFPPSKEVDAVVYAEERTASAPPCLIRTAASHKLSGFWLFQLFTRGLADAVG